MPPILTLVLEVGLICGLTVWQGRKLAQVRRILESADDTEIPTRCPLKFEPGLAFLAFWLRCFGFAFGLGLFNLVNSWSRLGSLDVALNSLGVLLTLAFVMGLGCGAWLFAGWWQPGWQRLWADFKRPRPRRRQHFNAEGEVEPLQIYQSEAVVMDLPPYHELNSPDSNSAVSWCDECGRWMATQHRHEPVPV